MFLRKFAVWVLSVQLNAMQTCTKWIQPEILILQINSALVTKAFLHIKKVQIVLFLPQKSIVNDSNNLSGIK